MLRPRVIPCLLVSNSGLVKTRRFSHPTYVGDPNNAIRIFNEKEVDELIVIDIDASKRRSGPNLRLIEEFAGECYMPVTYGGGIRSVSDAANVLSLGVEKVSLQSGVIEKPTLITDIASRFGNQAVVASVDVISADKGRPKLHRKRRMRQQPPWLSWLKTLENLGAGEILLTDVDREGSLVGINPHLIQQASSAVEVPLIAHGGVASLSDIRSAISAGASAVAAGSFFVYYGPHRAVLISYLSSADFEYLGTTA